MDLLDFFDGCSKLFEVLTFCCLNFEEWKEF